MYPLRLLLRPLAIELRILNYSSSHSPKYAKKRTGPTDRRRRLNSGMTGMVYQTEKADYSPDDFEELQDFEENELNLSTIDEMVDMHHSELATANRKRGLAMYGQKHYKTSKEPPMLTWADMEQIRFLHEEGKWPVEMLANSFPASELIINKILKSAYTPSFDAKLKHDQKVAENWRLLKKGKLEISDELRQHCLKFTARKAFPVAVKDVVVQNKPINVKGAFSSLLNKPGDDFKKHKKESEEEPYIENEDFIENSTLMQRIRKKGITLEEARRREIVKTSVDRDMDEDDKAFVFGLGAPKSAPPSEIKNQVNIQTHQSYSASEPNVVTKVKSTSEIIPKFSDSSLEAERDALNAPTDFYPERIKIPETAKKKGALYRVEDCFYDENGHFLYRVPGLKFEED